jgi:hypothetical protein
LPQLPFDPTIGGIAFGGAPPTLLLTLASDAETTLSTIHQGLGAIGHLLAHSSPVIEDGTIGADSLEALGFLLAELGDLAAACMTLAAQCRRASQQAAGGSHEST